MIVGSRWRSAYFWFVREYGDGGIQVQTMRVRSMQPTPCLFQTVVSFYSYRNYWEGLVGDYWVEVTADAR